ncbi:protein of unknown function [Nitrosotalea devaniterrae]|uniref:PARP-type domain-containing protein n=1 Tax=Nitrosotalea devaniterrae TaxID=1078905 RepID=A0A128A1N9_9ARCH|nr:protein of unknown function [Candidatus Nitrosotalea devanaterra]
MVLGNLVHVLQDFSAKGKSEQKFAKYCSTNFSSDEFHMMQIKLEPRDVARLSSFGNNVCRKCTIKLIEGDIVVRIGARPPKYYHKECFKVY